MVVYCEDMVLVALLCVAFGLFGRRIEKKHGKLRSGICPSTFIFSTLYIFNYADDCYIAEPTQQRSCILAACICCQAGRNFQWSFASTFASALDH